MRYGKKNIILNMQNTYSILCVNIKRKLLSAIKLIELSKIKKRKKKYLFSIILNKEYEKTILFSKVQPWHIHYRLFSKCSTHRPLQHPASRSLQRNVKAQANTWKLLQVQGLARFTIYIQIYKVIQPQGTRNILPTPYCRYSTER